MKKMRKNHDGAIKPKVALEATKEEKTMAQAFQQVSGLLEPDRAMEKASSGGSSLNFLG